VDVFVPEQLRDLPATLADDRDDHGRKRADGSERREVGEGPVDVAQGTERTHHQMTAGVMGAELI
jgi:hypothetical protein